jgi:hypothetical protein
VSEAGRIAILNQLIAGEVSPKDIKELKDTHVVRTDLFHALLMQISWDPKTQERVPGAPETIDECMKIFPHQMSDVMLNVLVKAARHEVCSSNICVCIQRRARRSIQLIMFVLWLLLVCVRFERRARRSIQMFVILYVLYYFVSTSECIKRRARRSIQLSVVTIYACL